jgi:hypothetical protein
MMRSQGAGGGAATRSIGRLTRSDRNARCSGYNDGRSGALALRDGVRDLSACPDLREFTSLRRCVGIGSELL